MKNQKKIDKILNALSIEVIAFYVLLVILCIYPIVDNMNEAFNLLPAILIIGLIYIFVPSLLLFLGLKFTKKYYKEKNGKHLLVAKILSICSFILNIIFVVLPFFSNLANILIIICLIFLMIPNVIHLLLIYNRDIKKYLSIIFGVLLILFILSRIILSPIEKLEVDYDKISTVREFDSLIDERKLRNSDIDGMNYILTYNEGNDYDLYDSIYESDYDNKYPIYIYASYDSVIGDIKGVWDIVSANGQMYAILSDIYGEDSLSSKLFNSKGLIVSDEDKITTYNYNGNYYSYGGGIDKLDSFSSLRKFIYGKNAVDFTYLLGDFVAVDRYNINCSEIIKVDEINKETLDRILQEIIDGKYL